MGRQSSKYSNLKPSRLGFNLFYSGLSGIISKIGALIFTIFVARILFPEVFGIYSLALTVILTLTTFSDLGFGGAITRYISESLGKNNQIQARSRFQFLIKFKFFSALIVSILIFIFSGLISISLNKPELVLPLKIGSIYLLVNAIYGSIAPLFLATQKLKYSTISESIFQLSRIFLIFIFLNLFRTSESVFIILIISLVFSLIYSFFVINKKFPFLVHGKTEFVERKRLLKFSLFSALGSLGVVFFSNIDKIVLGYFVSLELIGLYSAILTIISGVIGFIGIGAVFFPIFTQISGERLNLAFKKTFHYLAIIAFPASIGLAYVNIYFLKILFGDQYAPSQYSFSLFITSIFLSLIILESTFTKIYKILFNSKENSRIPAFVDISSSIMGIVLSILFIYFLVQIRPDYGLIGAAGAILISRVTGLFLLAFLCRKKFKISPKLDSIMKPLLASMVMLIYLITFHHLVNINLLTGIIMIISAALIYFLVIFLIKAINFTELKPLFSRD
jgi:O-antigen/teichoic acid export membrane protein